ncbi:hypothetical protein AN477_18025 [Alicyclobacillus ferrooxydans]|uniref:Uncharacterized protein n=1 Tax=Alicyclobacillus ferrooxydans TaxID=471514 RepID=A0A0P9CGR6_9BACL|nr:hypothetical protein AN477_18025 [Alicyclobacillus ferrooxydans]
MAVFAPGEGLGPVGMQLWRIGKTAVGSGQWAVGSRGKGMIIGNSGSGSAHSPWWPAANPVRWFVGLVGRMHSCDQANLR